MDIEIQTDSFGTEFVIIRKSEYEFISMPKAVWDEQQKAAELGGTF